MSSTIITVLLLMTDWFLFCPECSNCLACAQSRKALFTKRFKLEIVVLRFAACTSAVFLDTRRILSIDLRQ